MHKTIMLSLISLLFPIQSFALQFSYDNYSNISALKYSYSLENNTWSDAGSLIPHDYKTLQFKNTIPNKWQIKSPTKQPLECFDYSTKQPAENIIVLKKQEFVKTNDLLLDVLSQNGSNEFIAYIITNDGGGFGYYSNVIDCTLKNTQIIS